ncbi:MAG: hypothetical protein ACQEVA_00325 [Myxococcota bacterium]
MLTAIQWILDTAPSWTFGLILVAIIRWMSAKGLGFFLVELVDVETRLGRVSDPDSPLRDVASDTRTSGGCLASIATFLPVFALGWWVTVDLWLLLQSPENPRPTLGEHAFVSAAVVWVLILALSWGELRGRLDDWRRDFDERTIWTLVSILALWQLVLLMVAPFGLHLYWLVLRFLSYADEAWFAGAEAGSDIRSR